MIKEEYLAFIRYALNENTPVPEDFDDKGWQHFFDFCSRQGILGVVFAGIERADRAVPKQTLLEWYGSVEYYRVQNALVNERLHAVVKWFRDRGLRGVILKG